MHLFPWLFAASSVVRQVSGLPLLFHKAVVTKSDQHGHMQTNYYFRLNFDRPGVTERLVMSLKTAFDDETIPYIKETLNRFMMYCKVDIHSIASTASPISGKQIF